MEDEIIRMYFDTSHRIRTIARIFNKTNSNIGKIIQRHKKKYGIR